MAVYGSVGGDKLFAYGRSRSLDDMNYGLEYMGAGWSVGG